MVLYKDFIEEFTSSHFKSRNKGKLVYILLSFFEISLYVISWYYSYSKIYQNNSINTVVPDGYEGNPIVQIVRQEQSD